MVTDNIFWKVIKFVLFKSYDLIADLIVFLAKFENGGKPVIREIHGSKMFVDLNDVGIARELLIDKTREKSSTEEFKKRMKSGMVIADIGANIGYFALMESSFVGEKGQIYAFEPVPENVKLLEDSIKINGFKNIKTEKIAIGNKEDNVSFFLAETSNQGAIYLNDKTNIGKKINVKMTTLDKFFENKKKPDFVRMDVQGAELDVLKGMKKILKQPNLGVFIEVHGNQLGKKNKLEIFNILKNNGFNNIKIIKELPMKFKRFSKIIPKELLPMKEQFFEGTMDELLKNPPKGWFHLFAKK